MNEYIITFINDQGVYQELTFRGVSELVATSIAEGLNKAPFQAVTLAKREQTPIALDVAPLEPAPPLPDLAPIVEPVVPVGDTGPSEPEQPVAAGRKRK